MTRPFFARVTIRTTATGHLIIRAGQWAFVVPVGQVRVAKLRPWEHPDADSLLERARPIREVMRRKEVKHEAGPASGAEGTGAA